MKTLAGLTIQVTALDINRGEKYAPEACPVARAIKRATGRKVYVSNDIDTANNERYALPKRAQSFISAFDRASAVKPFSFRIGRRRR